MKCLNCGKEVTRKEGKREKKFCSDSCRATYHRKNKGPKPRWVSIEKYNELLVQVAKNNEPENKKRILEEREGIAPKPKVQNPITKEEAFKGKHRLWKEGDPKEGSGGFYMKYGFSTYDEIEKSKK